MSHSAIAVANYLLCRARLLGLALTPMQTLKLVYIAHGWNLAINGAPLIRNEVEAWEYGPVVRPLYEAVKRYGRDPITSQLVATQVDPIGGYVTASEPKDEFSEEERAVLDRVIEVYGPLRAFQLSGLTHREGTPWDKANSEGRTRIDDREIAAHFTKLAEEQDVDRRAR